MSHAEVALAANEALKDAPIRRRAGVRETDIRVALAKFEGFGYDGERYGWRHAAARFGDAVMAKSAGGFLHDRDSKIPDVHISVENFGPIERGSIDLRPMNIFVGPSNTGKTYLAVLIYALHRVLGGLPGFPPVIDYLFRDMPGMSKTIRKLSGKLDSESKGTQFSDLDDEDREKIQSIFTKSELLGSDLSGQLERCFGLKAICDLIRAPGVGNQARLSMAVGGSAKIPWRFDMNIRNSGIGTDGEFEDFDLKAVSDMVERFSNTMFSGDGFLSLASNLSRLGETVRRPEAYYLPANRSGVMHSHRVIASSLMQHASRAGPALPPFSGVMADFMQRLVHYGDSGPRADIPQQDPIDEIADTLEERTLDGQIRIVRPVPGGLPDFVYRQRQMKQDIRLDRASSMVSELAPVVLLIRDYIRTGDTLLIDEPEAHLHPAAQTEMAAALAGLVRMGVRVVITTHSDWFLQEIGNLMREGELAERTGDSPAAASGALRPSDVGTWLFDKSGTDGGATIREIPFDRIEGIEPEGYEDVAERLYNRSANLQDRLEELSASGKTER